MAAGLKGLVVGFIAMAMIGSMPPTGAMGEMGGHFTVDSATGSIELQEDATHFLEYSVQGLKGFVCKPGAFAGPIVAKTFEILSFSGKNKEVCKTTGGAYGESEIHWRGCKISLKVGKKSTAHNTTELVCPAGSELEITHQGCVVKVPSQVGFLGVSYKTELENNKHILTLSFTVGGTEMTANVEGGFCALLGTNHAIAITGSLTARAFDAAKAQIGITATGAEG